MTKKPPKCPKHGEYMAKASLGGRPPFTYVCAFCLREKVTA
jgi:hypothetical protein